MSDNLKIQGEVTLDATNADAAFGRVEAGARRMASSVKDSGKQADTAVKQIGDGAEVSAQKLDRGTKSMIASIQRLTAEEKTLAQGGKNSTAYLEERARQLGISSAAIQPYIRDLEAARTANAALDRSLGNVGMSAKATAAAMRGVPAQFTDIVTSIQGGQAPLTVFLQQGGQLKDMFGGAGNAARALGTYVLGLVNPFTVAAAAVAVLAVAYNAGSKEADGYRKAIALSGNAAGTTAGQLAGYAQNIAKVTGTQSAAAAALAEFATQGKVGAESLQQFTQAAIQFEKTTGQAVGETAKKFAELAKSPAEASAKLNEQYNYLTAAVYKQIKALEDQGRTTEAANLAQKTFADTIAGRAGEITGNLGLIESGWNAIKKAISGAGDALLNIGRTSTKEDQLAGINAQINAFQKAQDAAKARASGAGAAERIDAAGAPRLASLQAEAAVLGGIVFAERARATEKAKQNEQEQAGIAFAQAGVKFLGDKKKLELEITAARNLGKAAGLDEEEIEKRIAAIRLSYNKTGAAGTGQTEVADIKARTIAQEQYLEVLRTQGTEALKLTEGEKLVIKIKKELETNITGVARAEKVRALAAAEALAVVDRSVAGEEKRIAGLKLSREALLKSIDDVKREGDAILARAEAQEAANGVFGKGTTAIEQMRLAQMKQQLAEADSTDRFDPAYVASLRSKVEAQERFAAALQKTDYKTMNAGLDEWLRGAQEQATLYRDEAALSGLTALERAKVVAARQVELRYAKELAKIDQSQLSDAEKETLRIKAREAKEFESSAAVSKVVQDDFAKASEQIQQSLADALMNGGKSGAEYIKGLFRTMVLRPIINAAVSPVAGAVSSALGGSGGGAGILGAASNVSSISNLLGGAGAFGGALSSGFSLATSGLMGEALSGGVAMLSSATGLSSMLAGIGQIAGALGPIGLAIGAIGVLATSFKGETRIGGQYDTVKGLAAAPSGGEIAGGAVQQSIQATVSGINDLFKTLGSTTAVTYFNAGLESSKNGKGFTYAGGTLSDGTQFGNGFGAGYLNNRGSKTAEEAAAEFAVELQQSIVQALQASTDLPDAIKAIVNGVDSNALDAAGVKSVLDQINAVVANVRTFGAAVAGLPFDNLKNLAFDATAALFSLGGGVDSLTTSIASYYQNFYSQAERNANTLTNLGSSFAALGLSLPTTRDGFRDLVNSQNLATESGRATYATLLSLADAFASITPSAEELATAAQKAADEQAKAAAEQAKAAADAADAIKRAFQSASDSIVDEVKRIKGELAGGGAGGLAYAQSQFAIATGQARAGDSTAAASLPALSKAVLDLAAANASSSLDLKTMQAQILASLKATDASIVAQYGLTVPSFAVGTNSVPNDMLAQIHKDERIVPAADNRALMAAVQGGASQAVVDELRALRVEVAGLRESASATERSSARLDKNVNDMTKEGFPVINQPDSKLVFA